MRHESRESGHAARRSRSTPDRDAIALLKAGHREAEDLFGKFKKAKKLERKKSLAQKVCGALKVHMRIEEEIFYPAYLRATEDKDKHHEAEVEHAAAKKLISQIEKMAPGDEYYDAKMKVLSEMIKHHVKEEEKPGGMFAEARKTDMDLDDVGRRLAERKKELEANGTQETFGVKRSVLDA